MIENLVDRKMWNASARMLEKAFPFFNCQSCAPEAAAVELARGFSWRKFPRAENLHFQIAPSKKQSVRIQRAAVYVL